MINSTPRRLLSRLQGSGSPAAWACLFTTAPVSSAPCDEVADRSNRCYSNLATSSSGRDDRDEASSASGLHQQESRRQRMLERAKERLDSVDGPDMAARQRLLEVVQSKGRFYRTVHVKPAVDGKPGYQVFLDRHAVKTPAMRLLVLPTLPLALAVAAEWEWQEKGKPQMHSMPMMGLMATAIDQPKSMHKVIETTLRYLHTDSACCRYESGRLADRQAKAFDPLLQWAKDSLGWGLRTSEAITGAQQDLEIEGKARELLTGLTSWQLAAVEQLTAASKSLVVALAVLHGRVTADEAVVLARLEEDFQIEEWGAVEAGHDLDTADAISRVLSASIVLQLLARDKPRRKS